MKADFKMAIRAPFVAAPNRGKPRIKKKAAKPTSPQPVRIAVLMALAIHMDQLLREGHVSNQAELAKLAYVTNARATQIMSLLTLAPSIQETLLFATCRPAPHLTERHLRILVTELDWHNQRRLW